MRIPALVTAIALLISSSTYAQQAVEFNDYTVHYNAISTAQLQAQVAQAYGIKRSSNRAMLNITILKSSAEGPQAARGVLKATARNLTGQTRQIDMREINESGEAIYYIGEFRVNNMETFDFMIDVRPEGSAQLLEVRFRQQFYTE